MAIVKQKRLPLSLFLCLIIAIGALTPISIDMYLPALGDMVKELNTVESVMNMTLYMFMFTMAVAILVFGPIIDRYGRKIPMILCLVEFIISSFLCSLSQDIFSLIVFRILQAIGAGGLMTISTALIKDGFQGPSLSRVLYLLSIMGVLGPVVAPVLGSVLIETWGWRSTFLAPAFLSIILLIITAFLTETLPVEMRTATKISSAFTSLFVLTKNKPVMEFLMIFCIFNLPFMAYVSVSSYIYEGMFGLGPTEYSLLLAAAVICSVVIMAIMNKLTAHVINRKMLPVYLAATTIGAITLFLFGSTSWMLFFATNLIMMGASFTIRPWGMSILMRSHEGDNGSLSALINFMFSLLGTLGMIIATLPWGSYVEAIAYITLMASAVYLIMYLLLKKQGLENIREMNGTPAGQDIKE